MQLSKAVTFIVAALCVGLPIAGSILFIGSKLHLPSAPGVVTHSPQHAPGRPAFVKAEVESYSEKWVTDPVAQGTLGLVLVTGLLAIFTYRLFKSTRDLARDTRVASAKALVASTDATKTLANMERAYLTGGGDIEYIGLRRGFRVDVANYGKTAAYLAGFYVCFATRVELDARNPRRYLRRVFDDRIPPGGVTRSIARIEFNHPDAEFIYGGFFYRDLQKNRHVFRFILRIYPNGRTRPDVSHGVGQRYRKWT